MTRRISRSSETIIVNLTEEWIDTILDYLRLDDISIGSFWALYKKEWWRKYENWRE